MKHALIAFVIVFLVAGCGPPDAVLRADEYVKAGNCDAARMEIENSGIWMGNRAYMMAAVYHECYRDRVNAIKWATIAARYDVAAAREYLIKQGGPIPSPDLYRDSSLVCTTIGGILYCP